LKFTRQEYLYFILGVIFLSFGITLPLGIGIMIMLALRKMKEYSDFNKEPSEINVNFVN